MMEDSLCAPVIVEGDWTPDQTRVLNNKLQLYFGSKRKSNGGDCVVQLEEAAPRAAVYFGSEEVRERVLARDNHQITFENQTFKLRLVSASTPTNSDNVSESVSVVLDNVSGQMPRNLLLMLVEHISGLDDSSYSLEIIWETNQAVVTFSSPADVEKFFTVSQSSRKLEKLELTARRLEAAKSVRVEDLPPNMVKDMLELYFEKNWRLPDCITMIPDEQAAIVTFSDSKVVERICIKVDYEMRSIPVKIYPYYESLSTALYGKERPTWKMPEPFTECVHHAVWKFLLMKKLLKTINSQMHPYFCSVDLDNHKVKLSPLPSLLRQKDLTARDVDNWMITAQNAFCQQMSQYMAFECPASTAAWKAAEKDIRSVVREDAYVVLDASKGILTFAGQADRIKQIRAPVENIILKAMSGIERHTNGDSEEIKLSPAMFYILKQDGLQKAALDISPEMTLSYNDNTHKLTISGLPAEVFQTKLWILERKMQMRKKHLDVHQSLLDFLKNVDPMDMSQELFASQGISAIYSVESQGVFLLGSSDHALNDAQKKIEMALSSHTLDVEDQEVLKLPNWVSLNQKLLDTYNSSRKRTVAVQYHPERRDKVMVAGFLNPVKEISRSLKEFIVNYSHVQETFRVESCAVVQYMDKKKTQDCSNIAKDNSVTVDFDSERPRIIIAGARLHVHKAKSCLKELTSALFTDEFVVDKPGAKKYLQSQRSLFLSTVMTEFSCVVVLCPDKLNSSAKSQENHLKALYTRGGGGGRGGGGPWANRGYQSPRGHAKYGGVSPESSKVRLVPVPVPVPIFNMNRTQQRIITSPQFVNLRANHIRPQGFAIRHLTGPRNVQHEAEDFNESPVRQSQSQSQQPSDTLTALSNFIAGSGEERTNHLVLDEEEFEPTVFQLCADNAKAVSQAKKKIEELIVAEQTQRTITEPFISKLSQSDMEELNTLQRKLTVSIRLDRTQEDQEPKIHLEGLTRDVFMAESAVRDIIRKVERTENRSKKAVLMSRLVEWQFPHLNGTMMPFDIYTNLILEEALENKEKHVKIKIHNETYTADVKFKKAVSANGRKEVELLRKDLRVDAALPAHWDDMKGDLLKLFLVTAGSKEYNDVQTEFTKTGLSANIISIERVQNETLWQSYQLMKKQLEAKNKHKNNEKMLFHGTGSNSIDLINKQGFNRSYAGQHGAMYGNGSYFAVNPVYSAQGYARADARGHKRMYLARVLVGDFVQGQAGLISPPSRGSGKSDLYDSVTDNPARPTMFIIFNDIQAYPEYLITFT
ncbi:protein mono-ADP-ribosyltransferase PARP14-like isoform X3 [Scomber scombrus]|uniref:protein mono-ADP-ribosyltransferase PARP14-like isoform X3 n=1 Tax=Scomber scombrus TaxID=13677 RepID=UPI002DDB56E2|nr:protein mono-ADP-ribosyltransferase PARP14-like isoform X3 [Scomber scombrus]